MIRLIDGNVESIVSQSDCDAIMASKYVWSKEAHIAEINQLHDELFNSILSEYGYTSFAELSIWTQEPTNEYYTEANAIKEWYRSTWMSIKAYSETVTEPTAVEPQAFIDNLPKLIL